MPRDSSTASYATHLCDAEHTRATGFALGQALLRHYSSRPLIIALHGELGAGKTTFVSGLLAAMGYVGAVRSPTYTLIEPYEFKRQQMDADAVLSVFHLDLYRLTDPSQLNELGIRDLLQANTVLLIEWAERAGTKLAPADLAIQLSYSTGPNDLIGNASGRELVMTPSSPASEDLLHHMHI